MHFDLATTIGNLLVNYVVEKLDVIISHGIIGSPQNIDVENSPQVVNT